MGRSNRSQNSHILQIISEAGYPNGTTPQCYPLPMERTPTTMNNPTPMNAAVLRQRTKLALARKQALLESDVQAQCDKVYEHLLDYADRGESEATYTERLLPETLARLRGEGINLGLADSESDAHFSYRMSWPEPKVAV